MTFVALPNFSWSFVTLGEIMKALEFVMELVTDSTCILVLMLSVLCKLFFWESVLTVCLESGSMWYELLNAFGLVAADCM